MFKLKINEEPNETRFKKDPDFNLAAFMEENKDDFESSGKTETNVRSSGILLEQCHLIRF